MRGPKTPGLLQGTAWQSGGLTYTTQPTKLLCLTFWKSGVSVLVGKPQHWWNLYNDSGVRTIIMIKHLLANTFKCIPYEIILYLFSFLSLTVSFIKSAIFKFSNILSNKNGLLGL
jgi:hypothetical protein